MFLELIGVIFAGLATAGVVMILNRATGGRLPRWLAPVAAGAGMIAVTISSEYSWFARTSAALPGGLVVAEAVPHSSLYRPWTYAVPMINRFAAVDTASQQIHSSQPGQVLADVYFFGRWAPVSMVPVIFDCGGGRRAVVPPGTVFREDGSAEGLQWAAPEAGDGLLKAACGSTG